jgi:restriction system protein
MNLEKLRQDLQWLRGEDGVVEPWVATDVLARVLRPLLSLEGFDILEQDRGEPDNGFDLEASNRNVGQNEIASIGIQYKHFGGGRRIGSKDVRSLIGSGLRQSHPRMMLIGRFGFTESALKAARNQHPVAVDLVDLNDIERWISRVETEKPDNAAKFQALIRSISHNFAKAVAAEPEMLEHLEWRDLERMMARILEGLGFKVTLTPPSKDGGKDLVLTYSATQDDLSVIIELKHWRSKKKVGRASVEDFLQVIVREGRAGGLFISTSEYTSDAFEGLTQIERRTLRFGNRTKIVLLARNYVRAASGLWSAPSDLTEVLFQSTE